jgi:hypothetical protein
MEQFTIEKDIAQFIKKEVSAMPLLRPRLHFNVRPVRQPQGRNMALHRGQELW